MRFYQGNINPETSFQTIFVFGSNPEGRHGAGAARVALAFGAKYGKGSGLTFHPQKMLGAYAIPTKDLRVKENGGLRSISKENITKSIQTLYGVARKYPTWKFKIAYRNTLTASLNGYTGLEMIQMFKDAGPIPDNIWFAQEWEPYFK